MSLLIIIQCFHRISSCTYPNTSYNLQDIFLKIHIIASQENVLCFYHFYLFVYWIRFWYTQYSVHIIIWKINLCNGYCLICTLFFRLNKNIAKQKSKLKVRGAKLLVIYFSTYFYLKITYWFFTVIAPI